MRPRWSPCVTKWMPGCPRRYPQAQAEAGSLLQTPSSPPHPGQRQAETGRPSLRGTPGRRSLRRVPPLQRCGEISLTLLGLCFPNSSSSQAVLGWMEGITRSGAGKDEAGDRGQLPRWGQCWGPLREAPPSEHSILPRRLHREGIHPEITQPEPRPKSSMGGSWQCDQGHLGGHQLDDPLADPVPAPLPDSPSGPWAVVVSG